MSAGQGQMGIQGKWVKGRKYFEQHIYHLCTRCSFDSKVFDFFQRKNSLQYLIWCAFHFVYILLFLQWYNIILVHQTMIDVVHGNKTHISHILWTWVLELFIWSFGVKSWPVILTPSQNVHFNVKILGDMLEKVNMTN